MVARELKPILRLLCALLLVSAGCGGDGGGPGGPSIPGYQPGTILTFVSGETNQPVGNAVVLMGTSAYRTNPAGQLILSESVHLGTAIDVRATDFLPRLTRGRSPEETFFTLWPEASPTGLDPEFLRQIVYGGSHPDVMMRLAPSVTRVSVVPSPDILTDSEAHEAHLQACTRMTDATGGRITFQLENGGTAPVVVTTSLDPEHPVPASADRTTRNRYEITGARITFRTIHSARSVGVVIHELGHCFGLEHTTDQERDVMGRNPNGQQDLSPREKVVMNLMLLRRPGNLYPDNDFNVAGASTRNTQTIINCELQP